MEVAFCQDCPPDFRPFMQEVLEVVARWEKAENIQVLSIFLSDSGPYRVRFRKDTGKKYPETFTRFSDQPPVYGMIGDIMDLTLLHSVTLLSLDFPQNHQGKSCFKIRRFLEDYYLTAWTL